MSVKPNPFYASRSTTISRSRRNRVVELHGAKCHLCAEPIDLSLNFRDKMALTMDHVLPRYFGGTNAIENLRPAHRGCNSRKNFRTQAGDKRISRSEREALRREARAKAEAEESRIKASLDPNSLEYKLRFCGVEVIG